jgi:hypothetical protein
VLDLPFDTDAPLERVLGDVDSDTQGLVCCSGATNSGSRIRARVSGPGDRSSFAAVMER